MRCRQARVRITALRQSGSSAAIEPELANHLDQCPGCRALARSDTALGQIYDLVRPGDDSRVLPLETMRQKIESRVAASSPGESKDRRRRPIHFGQPRPRFRMALAVGTLTMLLLVAIIPMSYDRIAGYNLMLAGVSHDCAADNEAICDMLYRLGLSEADVDLLGCDSTCHLLIIDLRTREEASMVVTAFEDMCAGRVESSVIPIVNAESNSLLGRARQHVFSPDNGS